MPQPTAFWGIDIGQCALKALKLEMVDGQPTATAFDYVEHPKILSQPDADPDQLIREALEKFLSRNQIRYDLVAIGIAGQSGLARFVKLPPVEEKKIAEIVKFEAKQQIPFPLDEVVWDYQKVAGGDVTDGFAMETEIGLFAMKRDIIARYLGYFNAARIECHVVQMSPLALVNFATYEILKKGGTVPAEGPAEEADEAPRGKLRCVVVLDIGTDGSNLIITDGGKIIWQRPIPLGGNNFTRALTKDLKLTFAKAEHLKRNAAKSPELPQILKALKPVLTDFVGEVQRSLGYFTNTHRNAHVGYMVGLGSAFRLPGLQKYLAEKLGLDVRKPAEFARIKGESVLNDPLFQENLLTFPVAYGLALQAIGEARLTTNLLPGEIKVDRLIRAKKPFAVASAAALLLGTGALALGYSANLSSVNDSKIKSGMDTAKGAVAAFTAQEGKFTAKVKEFDDFKKELKAINAGQDERLNWPRFEEVFAAALPKPGEDGNLTQIEPKLKLDQPRIARGNNDDGVKAYEWFKKRMANGVPVDQAQQDERSAHPANLAMVNIEAVYPRWVDNVGQFLQTVDEQVYTIQKRDIAEDMKPDEIERDEGKNRFKPKAFEGGAWVIEVRGYTYHNQQRFIRDTLVRNLQRMDSFIPKEAEGKVSKYLPGVDDPVKGNVSRVFIYKTWPIDESPTGAPTFVGVSYLDDILGGAGGGAAGAAAGGEPRGPIGRGPAPSGPGVPGGTGTEPQQLAAPWVPLTGSSAGGGGPGSPLGAAGALFPRGGSGAAVIGPPGPPPGPGIISPAPAAPSSSKEGKDGEVRRRQEFVVMFVWKEPLPTSGADVK
jgi:type IV pilus assembly protein PilM